MCKNCQWLEVNDFKFKDGTQSISCVKLNRFLGFTESNGIIKNMKNVYDCKYKESLEAKAV